MLKKKLLVLLLSASMAMTMLAGCGSNTDKKDDTKTEASKDDASEAKTRRSLSWKMELIR